MWQFTCFPATTHLRHGRAESHPRCLRLQFTHADATCAFARRVDLGGSCVVLGGSGVAATKAGRRCVPPIAGASPAGGIFAGVAVVGCVLLIRSSEPVLLTG